MAHYLSIDWLTKVIRRPGFWFILALLVLISVPHYHELLKLPPFFIPIMTDLGVTRHAFERILYLVPIVLAGFLFGWRGAFLTSLAAIALMLPRVIFISLYPEDALFETIAVFIAGNILAVSFASLRKEREYRTRLEVAHQELQTSEERYRQLFENANDAIWLHDLDGNFITANKAAEKLSGYSVGELTTMNVKTFLSEESLNLARQIRSRLLQNEPVEQPYEQRLIRKDRSEAVLQLATSSVFDKGKPVAFQHIARDITEQKQMQENLRFYLQQVTKAQEEERKRISHELHDETVQALVVLSRQLDTLASSDKELPEDYRHRLEEIWQQTNDIIREVRRLSQDLRPAALDSLGLLPALEWLASDVTEYSGIVTKVNVLGEKQRLPEEEELVLFRIAQEALSNVRRHSKASKVEMTIDFADGALTLSISDNGRGFDMPQRTSDLALSGKLGIIGMQERARLVGATLTVQSEVGAGTTVTLRMPG